MPCLNNRLFVLDNETTNLVELSWAETMIPCEFDRRQPELSLMPVSPNVYVNGLVAIETVEKEPVRSGDPRDLRQSLAPSRYAPGARYRTCFALRRASIVSSTVRRTVVSIEVSAPPLLIASATAAMDTLSGASQRL